MENTVEQVSPIETALAKENITNQVIEKLKADYLGLKINGLDDKAGFKAVEEARKHCKAIRVLAVKICKSGREEAIAIQKQWIEKEKEVVAAIDITESHLEAQSDAIKELEKQILFEAAQKIKLPIRKEKLLTIGIEVADEELLKINDEQFNALFNEFHETYLAEKAEQLRIEQEKIATEKAEAQRIENERLAEIKRQADLKEAAEKARIEAENKAKLESEKKEREAKEAIAKAEREKQEAELRAKEAEQRELVRKEMELIQQNRLALILPFNDSDNKIDLSKLWELSDKDFETILNNKKAKFEQKQKEAADKIESDRKAAIAELERKQKEKELAELKAKQEAERLAEEKRLSDIEAELSKGDELKFTDFIADLEALKTKYTFKSKQNKALYQVAGTLIDKIINHINPTK